MLNKYCVCEEMLDRMIARWTCQVHGAREPNYPALFRRTLDELSAEDRQRATKRRIESVEIKRDERREDDWWLREEKGKHYASLANDRAMEREERKENEE